MSRQTGLAGDRTGSDNVVMELECVSEKHMDLVLSLFRRSPTYFLKVEGCLPGVPTVRDAILGRPPRTLESYRKEFLLLKKDGDHIGCVELHADHPEPYMVYIGLLLIRDDLHGRKLGRESYARVESYLRERFHCRRVRLGVSDDNDVSGFWSKMGYATNGRGYSWIGERKINNVVEYEKVLA